MSARRITKTDNNPVPYVKQAPLKVYGTTWCPHCTHQKQTLSQAGLNYKFVDASAMATVKAYPTLTCTKVHVGEMTAAKALAWCPGAAKK